MEGSDGGNGLLLLFPYPCQCIFLWKCSVGQMQKRRRQIFGFMKGKFLASLGERLEELQDGC